MKAQRKRFHIGKWVGYAVIPVLFLGVMHANPPAEAETILLTLDEAISEADQQRIMALPDVYSVKLVEL